MKIFYYVMIIILVFLFGTIYGRWLGTGRWIIPGHSFFQPIQSCKRYLVPFPPVKPSVKLLKLISVVKND